MTVLKNGRFVDGSGRRYIDASVNGAPHLYGSSTSTIVNSAFAGTGSSTRINPFERRRLKAARRAASDETSAPSQSEPSFVRKMGSRPRVR
jgi:hypothetical protein